MGTFLTIAGVVLLVWALGWGHLRFWSKRLTVSRPYDEVHYATTGDGARVALHRYRGEVSTDRPPVVLCHGIAANRYNLDLDDEHSLARYLHAQGRDVWLLELRGHGDSVPPAGGIQGFDPFVRHDVPTGLSAVGRATGAREVDWVGYSMGGLVLYAHLGTSERDDAVPAIRRLVTIGSPVLTRPGHSAGILTFVGRFLRGLPFAPLRGPSRFFAFAGAALQRLAGGVLGVPGSTAPLQVRRSMMNIVQNIAQRLQAQFSDWMARGAFDAADGSVDYAARMGDIRVPALVVGGRHDRLAPPGTVQAACDLLGSPQKRLLLMGREDGHRCDYGHIDLAFGRHAPQELYPAVADWCDVETNTGGADGRSTHPA